MKTTAKQNRPMNPPKQVRRVINRLLTAVDRTVKAAEDVKQARKDLDRLAMKREAVQ